jgi:hypothetical protein
MNNFTLTAVYLDESQLNYIITLSTAFAQEQKNFNFEYFDSNSSFCSIHGVDTFPSFYFMKNSKVAFIIQGKLGYSELKMKLRDRSYVIFDE